MSSGLVDRAWRPHSFPARTRPVPRLAVVLASRVDEAAKSMSDLAFVSAIYWLEGVLQDIVGYLYASVPPIIASRSEVNAGKYPSVFDFLERVGKARERTGHAGHEIGIHAERGLIAKVGREHLGSRPTGSRMARGIFRMGGGNEQRSPKRVSYRRWIPIRCSQRDCGDGPPIDISVFRIETGDGCVRHRDVEQGQQSGAF